jgi:hypothetical protein
VPLAALAGVAAALGARRRGNARWLAAAVAAVWCGLLGALLRGALGVGVVP